MHDSDGQTAGNRESRAEYLPPAEERRRWRHPGSYYRRSPAEGRPVRRRGVNEDGGGGGFAGGNPNQGRPRGGKRPGGVASPSPSTPLVRPNSSVAPRRVTFASPGVTATWPVPARCPCRRGRYRPRFKGTLLLLRKGNFEIGASYQLAPWQTPTPTRAVVDTGAGPSVIGADMLPEGWTECSSRAPPRTQVSDASPAAQGEHGGVSDHLCRGNRHGVRLPRGSVAVGTAHPRVGLPAKLRGHHIPKSQTIK